MRLSKGLVNVREFYIIVLYQVYTGLTATIAAVSVGFAAYHLPTRYAPGFVTAALCRSCSVTQPHLSG